MPTYTELANSTFMDFVSYRSNASGGPTGGHPLDASIKINVALVLDRANDPTALLQSDWATRQKELATLNDNGTLWATYGADPAKYAAVHTALASLGIKTLDQLSRETGTPNGYVSSVESRTVWVQVDGSTFSTLFGQQAKLMARGEPDATWYWTNSLALHDDLASRGVSGIWFDTVGKFEAQVADPGSGQAVHLPEHWQSVGNASTDGPSLFPQEIGSYYRLPLGSEVPTGTIGLIEPGVGTALPGYDDGSAFQAALDAYRRQAGVPTGAPAVSVARGGQAYEDPAQGNASGERSLDVSIVSTVAPNSPLVLYAGSGTNLNAEHAPFTVYQSAFWDLVNNPLVIGASPDITEHVAPGSPFWKASTELFVDAALRNITVFNAIGDGGSGGEYANGLTSIKSSRSLGYSVMVGGTSLSTSDAASADVTLTSIVESARAGDRDVIWSLIAGGMTQSPIGEMDGAAALVETIWNGYYLEGRELGGPRNPHPNGDYQANATGAGGADPSQPVPWYQTAYGLSPVTSDPAHLPGRGTPDVSANAGGNMFWHTAGPEMVLRSGARAIGTSASAPFWAGFGAQLNAVFADQGLPPLGYMTDLLYIASAIAAASFNDITIGNNVSSFVLGGDHYKSDDVPITPTGYGYHAEVGYDLVSGLGSPNGLLLARALTEIGHHQMHFSDVSPLIEGSAAAGWTSATEQTLLIQATIRAGHDASLDLGDQSIALQGGETDSFAWTPRFAQQSLQPDFDPTLVRMFDKQSQGWVDSLDVASGEGISARIGPSDGVARQAGLTSPYGLADFSAHDGNIHLARAVAVAETAGGANDQNAVVRVRQNGEDSLSVSFYRVDDLGGAIGTVKPGDANYAAAVVTRLYGLQGGGPELAGPGYGLFAQAAIVDVDAGDLVAMRLTNHTSGQTYFAFAQANGDKVAHLVNYGLNSWGFEDLYGGGDRDFNDFVVQLDFTSAAGHGWLA
jgi:hypothetical protein